MSASIAILENIPSSFVRSIDYNAKTRTMVVDLNGKTYSYPGILQRDYLRFLQGKAVCLTNDAVGYLPASGRWWRGKTPSLGAFYNQFIKLSGVRGIRGARAFRAKLSPKGMIKNIRWQRQLRMAGLI